MCPVCASHLLVVLSTYLFYHLILVEHGDALAYEKPGSTQSMSRWGLMARILGPPASRLLAPGTEHVCVQQAARPILPSESKRWKTYARHTSFCSDLF